MSNNFPSLGGERRPTLVVDPTKSGCPLTMACRYSLDQAVAAIERGQDDGARLLLEPREAAAAEAAEKGSGTTRALRWREDGEGASHDHTQ